MVRIVTDSTAYLPSELVAHYGIRVVPLNVNFADGTFRDGVDLTDQEFFQKLATADVLPTTSQPSAGDFLEVFKEASAQGDGVLVVTISGGLSGTYESALAAKDMLPGANVKVIDSQSTSMGLGFLVVAAAQAAEQGKGLDEVARLVEELVRKVQVYFVVDTLKYLQKGGRIGGAAALVGSLLNIKPILFLDDGKVEVFEKVRTKTKALERISEVLAEKTNGSHELHVAVIHAQAEAEARALSERIAARFHPSELHLTSVSPVIGTHTGPGVVGLAFYAA